MVQEFVKKNPEVKYIDTYPFAAGLGWTTTPRYSWQISCTLMRKATSAGGVRAAVCAEIKTKHQPESFRGKLQEKLQNSTSIIGVTL